MIFGFPRLTVPVVDGKNAMTRQWYRMFVQMGNTLGTINYGSVSAAAGTAVTVLTMTIGQSVRVHAFNQANSANNASADVFYDGTTLTISNLVTNGAGVTIVSSGANLQVKNTGGAGITIAWRTS